MCRWRARESGDGKEVDSSGWLETKVEVNKVQRERATAGAIYRGASREATVDDGSVMVGAGDGGRCASCVAHTTPRTAKAIPDNGTITQRKASLLIAPR